MIFWIAFILFPIVAFILGGVFGALINSPYATYRILFQCILDDQSIQPYEERLKLARYIYWITRSSNLCTLKQLNLLQEMLWETKK